MNNSQQIKKSYLMWEMGLEPDEDYAENSSTISKSVVRWTCIQQTSWHYKESNAGS